jgi:catechol 2,3-dioxygenase-like lactoylglutathione lyase family enzyme
VPPVDGILETALYVEDAERSAQFYESVFGFSVVTRVERLIALAVRPGQVLLLFKKGASAHMPQVPHDGDGQLHLAFAVPAPELTAWREWLRRNGLTIEHEQHWERGGVSLYFRDPDGHLVEVATPGVWTNY